MIRPIGSLVPTALFIVALAVTPSGPARAAGDCIVSPNSQLPQGGHWYYHMDRATGRKCWYVGPQDRKVHGQVMQDVAPRTPPAVEALAPLTPETLGERMMPVTQVEQPAILARPETATDNMTRAGTFPPTPAETIEREGPALSGPAEQERATTDSRDSEAQHDLQAQRPVMAVADMADPLLSTPVRILLVVIGALGIAGILLRPTFKITATRRSLRSQLDVDLAAVIAAARRAAPPLPPSYSPRDYAGAQARSDGKPNSSRDERHHLLEDVGEALLGVLRDWERPAASAKIAGISEVKPRIAGYQGRATHNVASG